MPHVVIIDEFLETKTGHYYEYDKTTMQSLASDCSFRLYAKKSVQQDIQDELGAIPFFEYNPQHWVRSIKGIGAFLYRFYTWHTIRKQIQQIVSLESQNHSDCIFFLPNLFWYNVWPYAQVFGKHNYRALGLYRTSVLDAIDIPQSLQVWIEKLYAHTTRLFSQNVNFQFVSDSQVIADQFTQKFHRPMKVLPIPHVFELDDFATNEPDMFSIYHPGNVRVEKGIESIVTALEWIQENEPLWMKKIHVVFQFFGNHEQEIILPLQHRIQQLRCQQTIEGKLSSEAYKKIYGDSHLILIPYLNSRGYQARTSGVLAEAIAASKPFITTAQSWMDVQSKQYQTGIAVPDQDGIALAHAIIQILSNYTQYKQQARAAKSLWLAFHSKQNFKNVFLS